MLIVMCFILLISCPNVIAKETEELSLKERIVKLETKVDEGFKRVNEGPKSVNQRIDDVNQKYR